MKNTTDASPFYFSSMFPWILVALGSVLSFFMFHTLELHDDNVQILLKVHKLLFLGEWSHFGNRGSGVGFVPGSAMTAITAWPMKLWFSPHAAGMVIWLTQLLSLWFLYDCSKRFAIPLTGVFVLLFFWLNPWRVEQMELYNPAYLFFFASLHLWTGMKMKDKSFWATALHVLSIGICVQFHFSALILGIASLILLYYRWFKVHWLGFATGTALTLLSLVPWYLAWSSQPELAITVADPDKAFLGRNFLYVYPVLKAVLYWVRYSSTYFARHIFTEVEFAWISWEWLRIIVSWAFDIFKWALAIVTIVWSFKINWLLFKAARRQKFFSSPSKVQWPEDAFTHFQRYLCYLFLGMIITAGLSPVEFNHWHLILCFPAVSLFLSLKVAQRMQRKSFRKVSMAIVGVVLIFSLHSLFAAFGSRSHSLGTNYHTEAMRFFNSH